MTGDWVGTTSKKFAKNTVTSHWELERNFQIYENINKKCLEYITMHFLLIKIKANTI